jgi:hypothetical protein
LLTTVRHSDEQFSPVRHEETGASAGSRREMRGPGVMVGILLIEYIDEALATNN